MYMLHIYRISAWVILIHMLLYAGFYCSDTNLIQYNTIQYNTLFNHATFRSEKRSLKHVRAKTMYTINTIQ